MALTVENGTGLSDAESYCSVAEATTYFAKRGKADAWDAVADQEAALRMAADYMTQTYRSRWAGYRKTDTQALDWPREMVPRLDSNARFAYVDDDIVPTEVKAACAELALRTADGDLVQDLTREVASESVGEISVSYVSGSNRQKRYDAVERMLAPYLTAGGGIPVARA